MRSIRELVAQENAGSPPVSLRALAGNHKVGSLAGLVASHDINEFHRKTGEDVGPCGSTRGGILQQPDGTYTRSYQFTSAIRPAGAGGLPTASTRYLADVKVAALRCFGTEDPGGEDEPYMCITLYSYDPTISAEKQVKTVLIGYETGVSPSGKNVVYEGRNVGEAFVTGRGFRIRVDLWERESGDPEDFRRNIEDNVKTGVRVGLSVLANAIGAGEAGEALAQAFSGIAGKGATALLEEIFGDDFIGSRDFNVSGQFLEQIKDDIDGSLIRHTPGLPERIVFNFPRDSQEMYWLISGGGGSYKVYFTITAIRADQPITP